MATFDKLIDHLPTLWRPEPGDSTLLAQWLRAVGSTFDAGAADIQHVLRAHWFDTADAAAWARHFAADRAERGLGALRAGNNADRREAATYPYVSDLARLGAMLDLPPWRDPASLREGVEEYRQRVGDVLGAYRAGLVTPAALRKLVDAALPEVMGAPLSGQRRAYAVEEPVSLRSTTRPLVATPVVEEGDRVAPLSRWALGSTGSPGFVLQGVAADAIGAATLNPMVERWTPGAAVAGIGVAYAGTLAPGQALRLTPGRRHWLLRGADVLASVAETADNAARDPSANGPFDTAASLAAGQALAVSGAADGALWLLVQDGAAFGVQRFDGSALQAVDTDAPAGPFHALLCHGDSAWLGTDAGLFRCPLWPTGGVLAWAAVPAVTGAVRVLVAAAADGLLAAGAQGLWELDASGVVMARRHAGVDLVAYAAQATDGGREWLATARALFIARQGKLWRYDGQAVSEDSADWVEVATADNAQASPLPTVQSIAVTPDGSAWLGGPAGLARWFAGADGSTRLAAFPDVFTGTVRQLAVDDRGLLWIAGDDGLFRFDGRDLAQFDLAAARWLPLGDADQIFPDEQRSEARGFWRFDRAAARWQRFDASARRFADAALPARAAAADAIAAVLMRPALRAELGSLDGTTFSPSAEVPPASLRMRIKPDPTRCIDGVSPYLPPDTGYATWRYLQMDTAPVPPPAGAKPQPWWSTEGQLFPPPPLHPAPVPGHRRDASTFLTDPQGEGQFDRAVFVYPPSARLWALLPGEPAVGIRVRLFQQDPGQPLDPALADRVWQLIRRARPAGVPLQLMAEGSILKESSS
jgi:hypothetical protein